MTRATLCIILALGLISTSAQSAPMLTGVTTGPDSSFSINFSFTNASASETITSLFMNGATATAFPIVWDSIGTLGGQTATVSGVDSVRVDFLFTSSWDPAELFTLTGVDPDKVGDASSGVTIGQLAGVQVGATFSGGTSLLYSFVDNTASGAGLVLASLASVPEPSIIALFGLGLLGLGFARRRKA